MQVQTRAAEVAGLVLAEGFDFTDEAQRLKATAAVLRWAGLASLFPGDLLPSVLVDAETIEPVSHIAQIMSRGFMDWTNPATIGDLIRHWPALRSMSVPELLACMPEAGAPICFPVRAPLQC